MDCLISFNITLNWTHTVIPYSCSVGSGLTGSKRSTMKGMASAFYTNGTKTGASNGRGPAKKQNRYLNSSSAGFWKGLNPEQPKAVQKWLPHKSETLKILKNTGKSDLFYGTMKASKRKDFQPMPNTGTGV